jgi:hypothetical protein
MNEHGPGPSSEDRRIYNPDHAYDVAIEADDLLDVGGNPLGAQPNEEEIEKRRHEKAAAVAAAQALVENPGSFESARGIARAAATKIQRLKPKTGPMSGRPSPMISLAYPTSGPCGWPYRRPRLTLTFP